LAVVEPVQVLGRLAVRQALSFVQPVLPRLLLHFVAAKSIALVAA
jgi:hypothetical protein